MPFVGFDEPTLLKVLSVAVEQNYSPIYVTDPVGTLLYVNLAFCRMSGYSSEELLGNNASMMKSGLLPADHYRPMWQELLTGKSWKGVFPNRKKGGELYWEESTISPIVNGINQIEYFVAVMVDVTETKQKQETLETLATIDPLTEVLNRRTVVQILEREIAIAVKEKTPLSLAYVDLNELKSINDHFGHKKGDELIQLFCRFVKDQIRETDTLCRMGGDEFMIIFPGCAVPCAFDTLTQIHESFIHGSKDEISHHGFSFGIGEYDPNLKLSVDRFISFADKKMYLNKRRFHRKMAREH